MLFNFICSKFVESNKNIGECGYKNDISSKITYNTKVYEYPDLELGFGPIIKIKDNDYSDWNYICLYPDDNYIIFGLKVNSINVEITKRYYRYYMKKSKKALTDLLLLKYYLGENIGINKSDTEKKLTKLFTGINLDVRLDKNIDHML